MFKRWNTIFDAQREKVAEILVWVRLPELSPHFWTKEVFRAIGNTLGIFLEADMYFRETRDMILARTLVRLDPREGLAEEIHLQYQYYSYTQIIDYEQLPFRCHRCHKYVHLAWDFPLGIRRRRRHRGEARNGELPQAEEEELAKAEELGNQQEGQQEPMEIQKYRDR